MRRTQITSLLSDYNLWPCLPPQSYADGSQYMASHDSLSPPYTNSRLTGTAQVKRVSVIALNSTSFLSSAVDSSLCWDVCVFMCVRLQRISETLVYTGGDRSSGMRFLSRSLSLPLSAHCVEKRQGVCAHLPMMLSASGSLRCGASCEQMATDTDNLPLSFSHSHTHGASYNHWNSNTHTCTHTAQNLITFDWMHQIWKMSALQLYLLSFRLSLLLSLTFRGSSRFLKHFIPNLSGWRVKSLLFPIFVREMPATQKHR